MKSNIYPWEADVSRIQVSEACDEDLLGVRIAC